MKSKVKVIAVLSSALILIAAVWWWHFLGPGAYFTPHVRVEVSSDGFPTAGQKSPNYSLYLKGANRSEITFSGDQLIHRYADECRCYQVYGVGDLLWGAVRIRVDDQWVKVNGRDLPKKAVVGHFIVDPDGRVSEGAIMTAE